MLLVCGRAWGGAMNSRALLRPVGLSSFPIEASHIMHLINCNTRQLEDFTGSNIPRYAILSHTWGEGEVSYAELKHDQAASRLKEGYRKIDFTCQQTLLDGLQYAWVDTCCIDKTSSAELSEAINSMFRWYEDAEVCYVYLSDVYSADCGQQLPRSRWFTRGWTLQELLAPEHVTFYDTQWIQLGTKIEFADWLHRITNIDKQALIKTRYLGENNVLDRFCSAQKMSWASTRQTTREEDMAYSLLGIFNVTMPLLYGEGTRAFKRLQETILSQTGDDTILAWNFDTKITETSPFEVARLVPSYLAESPQDFVNCGQLRYAPHRVKMVLTNMGLQINTPLLPLRSNEDNESKRWMALLNCTIDGSTRFVGIILQSIENNTPIDRLFYPLVLMEQHFHAQYVHATTVDARAVAEASLQQITIVPYSSIRPTAQSASWGYTHILMFPTTTFVAAGLCILDVKGICTHESFVLNPIQDAFWDSANNELIVASHSFDTNYPHYSHIFLWVKDAKDASDPLFRIQLCTMCGVYAVTRWHKDLQHQNDLSRESHMVSNQMFFPVPDCIFRLKVTKKDICQRRFIMVDIDLGIEP
jgi:hypothetical protein